MSYVTYGGANFIANLLYFRLYVISIELFLMSVTAGVQNAESSMYQTTQYVYYMYVCGGGVDTVTKCWFLTWIPHLLNQNN